MSAQRALYSGPLGGAGAVAADLDRINQLLRATGCR